MNISPVRESIRQAQSTPYCLSEVGMEMLTKSVALDVADKGIQVNGIAPGIITTEMNKEILQDEKKERGGMILI